jgi:hypothetical protein
VGIREKIALSLPSVIDSVVKEQVAYTLVAPVLSPVFGGQDTGWHTGRRPSKSGEGQMTTWVVLGPKPEEE